MIVPKSILESLEKLGLTDKEASAYVSAVHLGECGMSELSKKAGLKRTSAYVVCQSLEKKGLIGTYKTRLGTRFVAKDPKYLLEETHKKVAELEHILPELKALQKSNTNKPVMTYHEGPEAYVRAIEECLKKPHTTIRHIGSLTEGHRVFGEEYDFKYFMPERIKRHIYLKALYTPDIAQKLPSDEGMLREIRFLPKEYPVKTLTLIFENTVVISTTKKTLVTVVIESDEIAEAEKLKFDLLWELSKRAGA
jgi:sugar-specific transcriptional regulator TrmB